MRIHSLGAVYFLPESRQAINARATIHALSPISRYHFTRRGAEHFLTQTKPETSAQQDVGPEEMIYFGMEKSRDWSTSDTRMHEGLASCRIKQGDVIWHVPYTKMSFVVREDIDAREIIGRAHPLGNANGVGEAATWKKSPWGLSLWSYGAEEDIYVDLATMFTLRNLADPQEEFGKDHQEEEKGKPQPSRWEQAETLRKAREAQELKQKQAEAAAQRRKQLHEAAERERAENLQRKRAAEQRKIKLIEQARLEDRIKSLTSLAEGAEANIAQMDGFEKKWAEEDAAAAAAQKDAPEDIFRQNPGGAALFASFPAEWQPMLRASQVYSNQVAEATRIEGRQRMREGAFRRLRDSVPEAIQGLQDEFLKAAGLALEDNRPRERLAWNLRRQFWSPPSKIAAELWELLGRFDEVMRRCGGRYIED
jgi:hypothetical protein